MSKNRRMSRARRLLRRSDAQMAEAARLRAEVRRLRNQTVMEVVAAEGSMGITTDAGLARMTAALGDGSSFCSLCVDGKHDACVAIKDLVGADHLCQCPHPVVPLSTWRELFPEGRHIFYEGDDPGGCRNAIIAEFGFDPALISGVYDPGWPDSGFFCPPEHLDAIYGGGRWPMGS
jgi:hypothetical protein